MEPNTDECSSVVKYDRDFKMVYAGEALGSAEDFVNKTGLQGHLCKLLIYFIRLYEPARRANKQSKE